MRRVAGVADLLLEFLGCCLLVLLLVLRCHFSDEDGRRRLLDLEMLGKGSKHVAMRTRRAIDSQLAQHSVGLL